MSKNIEVSAILRRLDFMDTRSVLKEMSGKHSMHRVEWDWLAPSSPVRFPMEVCDVVALVLVGPSANEFMTTEPMWHSCNSLIVMAWRHRISLGQLEK